MIGFLRRLGFVLAGILALGGGGVLLLSAMGITAPGQWFRQTAGLTLPLPGDLRLTNAATGQAFTSADLHGRWTLLYFGYTFCPDVCPTDLAEAVRAFGLMGAQAEEITPVFVTVDPARDNAAVMARYVALFSPRLLGLTGTAAEIAEAERMFRVYAEKQPIPNGGGAYLMNHSAFFYLLGPSGEVVAILSPDLKPRGLAQALEKALAQPAS